MPGFSLGQLLGFPATPPEEIPKDALPTVGEETFPDPSQPATARPELDATHIAEVLDLAAIFFRRGIADQAPEGAQETPTLQHGQLTVQSTYQAVIPGNHKRLSLQLYNNGAATCYVVDPLATTTAQGMPIPVGAEREIRTANAVRLLSDGTSDVRYLEESS